MDADSAMEKVATGKFKIVLTDIVMPGLDGIELLRRIKNINPGIQVIMMTGQPTLMRASESLQDGALRYLLKPFDDIREVDEAVEEAIQKLKSWEDAFLKRKRPQQSLWKSNMEGSWADLVHCFISLATYCHFERSEKF